MWYQHEPLFPRYTWFVCQTGQKKYTLVVGVIGKNTWWEETNTKLNQFYEFTMFNMFEGQQI